MAVSVFAPASIGNVNVGFDVLGLAVKPIDGTLLGDVVNVALGNGSESTLTVIGTYADKLPQDPQQNIVWHCLALFNQALSSSGHKVEVVDIQLDKKMPVGSGLGSSACSIVAALHGLNCFYQNIFSKHDMLIMMGKMEAQISGSLHYDNVAPCFLGGLQLMLPVEGKISQALPLFTDCYWVMAYPGIEVSTKMAREVLPTSYSRADLIKAGQNLATFIDASYRQDKQVAFSVLTDIVAEPYRQHLLPKFVEAKQTLLAQGALSVGISGSGPTLFAVVDNLDKAKATANWLQQHYLQTELGFVHVCKADQTGACELPLNTTDRN